MWAIDLLNQAVARDPAFLQAYCRLAFAHDFLYFNDVDLTPARLAMAEAAIQEAFRIRPNAGEAHFARQYIIIEATATMRALWLTEIAKCLEKDPEWRYSSALALAEDLEHWLKHEPIRAKPSGFFTHGRKWVRRNPSSALLAASLIALAAAAGWIVWKSEFIRHPVTGGIAVLPFENLSPDAGHAYLADGIQEEILTRLAKIADLKVISRTSTQRYQSKPRNLSQIAKQLGVANILEGSVQKAADQVRVNVQLINAQTDSHLWAETYDRKLTDIFGVESEIAKGIAESLQAKLTGREEQAIAVKPTNNPEAYDAYLRGQAFEVNRGSTDGTRKAIEFYEQAVQLDPNFALSWARLSRANAFLYFQRDNKTAARRDAAKRALDNAQKLEPNSPETLLALGYYQYWVLLDFVLAKTTFGVVSKMLPGNSEVLNALARVTLREGNWGESLIYREKALVLDPLNWELLDGAASTYIMLRQFAPALKLYNRAVEIVHNDPGLVVAKAAVYQAQGNLQEAAKLLSEVNAQTPSVASFATTIVQLRLERNLGEAVRLLQARQAQFHFASEIDKSVDQVTLATIQRVAGDTAGAKVTAEQARHMLETLCKNQPDNFFFAEQLALANAVLGEKDSALKEAERAIMLFNAMLGEKDSASKEAERAIMLVPSAKDRVNGPTREEVGALIQTVLGENERAISILTRLLQTPYQSWLYGPPITPALLRLDPIWDPLRGDPAFQKLCGEKQP